MSTQEIKTACRGCHGGCGAIVTVEDGTVTKIRPDPDSPVSKGRMCPKGLSAIELLYHPDRLNHPLKRVGQRGEGKWEEITWDEAYTMIVENLEQVKQEYGMESVVVVQGTGRHHFHQTVRFTNTIGTPNWMEPGQAQCFQPRVNNFIMTYGHPLVVDYYGNTHPECILVWGHNPTISGSDGELSYCITDAIKGGSQLIVVDPRPTDLAKKAALWLPIRPGTDCALAMAMLHVIIEEHLYDEEFVTNWTHGFDALCHRVKECTPKWAAAICWLEEEKIYEAARMFAKAGTAALEWGCALEQTPNAFDTIRAISFLPGITGNFDIPGGMVEGPKLIPDCSANYENLAPDMHQKRLGAQAHPILSGTKVPIPSSHTPSVFDALETGVPYPIKTMLLFGNNGLMGFANSHKTKELLGKVDFLSCMDLFMTPTAQLCDLVLPAACWLEVNALYGAPFFATPNAMAQKKVVRLFDRKADEDVYCDLCKKMGLDFGGDTIEALLDQQVAMLAGNFPQFSHLSDFASLCQESYLEIPMEYHQYRTNGKLDTPTGKMELVSTIMESYGLDPLPKYEEPPESPVSTPDLAKEFPLVLTTGGRSRFYFLSEGRQISSCRKAHPHPLVELSPELAAQHGIADGDWVWIESPRGKITQKAKLLAGMDPRVVNCQHGWWYPEEEQGSDGWCRSNANVLTNGAPPYGQAMGTYQLRALLCRIWKNT